MKSLMERHVDRAQRKADNLAESGNLNATNGVGAALIAISAAKDAVSSLPPEARERLMDTMNGDDGFSNVPDNSLAGLSMAGIGVLNPLVVPAEALQEAAGNGASNGELPLPRFDPAEGNLNGAAVADAGTGAGSWGQSSANSSSDGYSALTVAELKAKLDDGGVSYDPKANKDGLVAALRESNKNAS